MSPPTAPGGKLPLTALVLTLNEQRNLPACLESIAPYVQRIEVVDSHSTDRTEEIARSFGCGFVKHEFRNQAEQLQWALDTLAFETDWVVRVDADERWTPEGFEALRPLLADETLSGVSVRMKIMFMGRWIRHGAMYPNDFLRVFRRSRSDVELRWMDEHVRVEGRAISTPIDVIESNYDRQENIGLWTAKHNAYSTREAIDILLREEDAASVDSIADLGGGRTARKRWLKEHVYGRVPLLARSFLYFAYRYFVKLGILDGREGFVFHVLHGFWYRFLVDVKVVQLKRLAAARGQLVRDVVLDSYGIDMRALEEAAERRRSRRAEASRG